MQPLGTGPCSLGTGLEQADKQFGVPPHTPGARSTDSARGEAGRAAPGRQSPGRARRAPGGPAPSSAASFAGLFLRGSGSRPSLAANNSSGPALGSRLPTPGEAGAGPRGGGRRPRRRGSAANPQPRPGLRRSSALPGSLLAGTEAREPGGGAGVAAAAGARGGARERGREAASERAGERASERGEEVERQGGWEGGGKIKRSAEQG